MTGAMQDAVLRFAAQQGPWTWVPRPTVWLLVVGVSLLYWYAITRIGPRATTTGETIVSRAQIAWFIAAMVVLWLASDWPLHDIGENYLYSAHMAQHLLLSLGSRQWPGWPRRHGSLAWWSVPAGDTGRSDASPARWLPR